MLHVENDDPKQREVQMHCGTSTFYLSKSLLEMGQLSNAIVNIGPQEEPGPPIMNSELQIHYGTSTFYLWRALPDILNIGQTEEPGPLLMNPEKEELLKDVLYSIDCLMGKSGMWKVKESNKMFGIACQQEVPTTVVTLHEVTQHLQDTFHTDEHTLQGLREDAQRRKPAEFCLNLTVLEADIQCLKDGKLKGPTNTYVRIKLGPKLLEDYDTPQIKGTRYPKWKHDMKLKLWDFFSDYLVIQLWQEKEEDTRKRRHLIPGYLQEPIKPELLADISLPLKETLESGITGWYDLQDCLESKMRVTARVQLSGHISCVSDIKFNNQEAYDTLLRCFINHQINNNSQDTDQVRSTGDYWREESMPANVRAVLSQYSLILNLSKASQLLSWWNNVTNMSSPIDWDLVLTQFNCIKTSLVMRSYSTEEEQYLTSAISRIIDNCIRDVKHLERCFPLALRDQSESQLSSLLRTIRSIESHPNIKSLLKEEIRFNLQEVIKAGLQGFSRHWWNKMVDLMKQKSTRKENQLEAVLTITKEVFALLQCVSGFYEPIFSRWSDVCCMKIVYQTVVTELMEVIERVITSCCKTIPVSIKLIGDDGVECDFLKGSHLMKIYKILSAVSQFSCHHLSSMAVCNTGVEEYYKHFETGFENQLALTTDREYHLIDEITSKDTLEPISTETHFSASLLEATAIPHRMKVWWYELSWPDLEDRAVFMLQVLKNLIFLSVSYCENLCKKIDYIIEDRKGNSQQFINEKVCVAVTNIENILQEAKKFPEILGYTYLETKIEPQISMQITEVVKNATLNFKALLKAFIVKVIDKRKEYLQRRIITSCQGKDVSGSSAWVCLNPITQSNPCQGKDISVFLETVLHPTIDLLREWLNPRSAQEFLECFWESFLKIMKNIVTDGTERDPAFYGEMLKLAKKTFRDLTPDSDEALDALSAETEEYKSLIEDLSLMERSTMSLITSYYQERYKERQQESASASLVIRTWFKENNILNVHVLMVQNIVVPPDESRNAPLDYYIKINVLPDEFNQLTETTQVLKEDPAIFNQEFEVDVGSNNVNIQEGVLLLTLNDQNRTRSDTFLGESVVPLADITSDPNKVKHMYLQMTPPCFDEGCKKIIQVLRSRGSNKQATSFLKKLRKISTVAI